MKFLITLAFLLTISMAQGTEMSPFSLSAKMGVRYKTTHVELDKTYRFKSPNYPESYPSSFWGYVKYRIPANAAVSLTCSDIDLPCTTSGNGNFRRGDYLYLVFHSQNQHRTRVCSELPMPEVLQHPPQERSYNFYAFLRTDSSQNGKGFNCELRAESPATQTCTCGRAESNDGHRIVGGAESDQHHHPWQVALFSCFDSDCQDNRYQFCGGTIISADFVLTAAHCVDDDDFGGMGVGIGEHNVEDPAPGSYVVRVQDVKSHPMYNSRTSNYDFALLKLAQRISFTETARPACLPSSLSIDYTGMTATITGWGRFYSGGPSPDNLHEVNVTVISNSICSAQYAGRDNVTAQMICASEPGKDSCQGDSGGPMMVDNTLVGVVSWGWGCANAGSPGVYARVTSILNTDFMEDVAVCSV